MNTEIVQRAVDWMFVPPPMPELSLPFGARITGALATIEKAFALAYWAGVKDGLMWGAILTLAVMFVVTIIVALKINPFRSLLNVITAIL